MWLNLNDGDENSILFSEQKYIQNVWLDLKFEASAFWVVSTLCYCPALEH